MVAVLGLSGQLTHHCHKGRRLVVPVDPGAVEKVKVKKMYHYTNPSIVNMAVEKVKTSTIAKNCNMPVVVEVGGELVVDRLGGLQVCWVSSSLCHPGLSKVHLALICNLKSKFAIRSFIMFKVKQNED